MISRGQLLSLRLHSFCWGGMWLSHRQCVVILWLQSYREYPAALISMRTSHCFLASRSTLACRNVPYISLCAPAGLIPEVNTSGEQAAATALRQVCAGKSSVAGATVDHKSIRPDCEP